MCSCCCDDVAKCSRLGLLVTCMNTSAYSNFLQEKDNELQDRMIDEHAGMQVRLHNTTIWHQQKNLGSFQMLTGLDLWPGDMLDI